MKAHEMYDMNSHEILKVINEYAAFLQTNICVDYFIFKYAEFITIRREMLNFIIFCVAMYFAYI